MSEGEIMYLALCATAALAFVLSLVYATTVASGGPRTGGTQPGGAE